jgi:Nucleoside-diphosphate-sugar epimerases
VEAAQGLAAPVGVLGAGGKMGLHVARMARVALDRAGRPEVPVVAVSRFSSLRARDEFESRGISTVAADLLDENALAALPDFGTVYFLAGMKFGSAEKPDVLRLFNEVMPARVAERYRKSVIVALSTGCVYPFVSPETGGSRETDPAEPLGDYAVSCYGREKAFSEASQRNGTPVALIRLNYSVEYRYGVLVDVAQKVLNGDPVDVKMGYVNVIWQRDAVEHVLRAQAVAASPATVLNVTGKPIVSVRHLAEEFGKRFGKDPVITGSEEPTAWLNDASRAHELFGKPTVSLEEMIDRVAGWLSAGGPTHGKPTKFEVRDGKF